MYHGNSGKTTWLASTIYVVNTSPRLQRPGQRDAFRGREALMLLSSIPCHACPLDTQPLVPTHTGRSGFPGTPHSGDAHAHQARQHISSFCCCICFRCESKDGAREP